MRVQRRCLVVQIERLSPTCRRWTLLGGAVPVVPPRAQLERKVEAINGYVCRPVKL